MIRIASAFFLCLLAGPALAQTACPTYPAGAFQLAAPPATGIIRLSDNATIPRDPNNRDFACEQVWEQAGNMPLAAPAPTNTQKAMADLSAKIGTGLQITSTGTPALNGTYAIDPQTQANIIAIYSGIKGGDGVPGGGTTFNFQDAAGAPHAFTGPQFLTFAKAVRDYVYALKEVARVEAGGGTPTWPTQPAMIP